MFELGKMRLDLTSTLLAKYIPNADTVITIQAYKSTSSRDLGDRDRVFLSCFLFNIVNISNSRSPLVVVST